jgi:hypothetical protein
MNFSPVISGAASATHGAASVAIHLVIEPGLTRRHDSVRDVVATGVYQRGLSRTAADVGVPAGNLSVQLSGTGQRHLSVESLERYIEQTGDHRPIHYLIERFLLTPERSADDAHRAQVLQQMQALMSSLDR